MTTFFLHTPNIRLCTVRVLQSRLHLNCTSCRCFILHTTTRTTTTMTNSRSSLVSPIYPLPVVCLLLSLLVVLIIPPPTPPPALFVSAFTAVPVVIRSVPAPVHHRYYCEEKEEEEEESSSSSSSAFSSRSTIRRGRGRSGNVRREASKKQSTPTSSSSSTDEQDQKNNKAPFSTTTTTTTSDDDMNPVTKASWYAVEWFGKAFGGRRQANSKRSDNDDDDSLVISYSGPPKSIQETLERIKVDINDRSYFLSGQVDEEIYAEDCVFRDPFVSFQGRDRFVTNLANLGSFITKYNAKVLEYNTIITQEEEPNNETKIQTKIMVKLELNLPWKPILAWPWGVTYTVDPQTYCVVDHEESWDIEPWEGVKQIFRKPTLKL